MYSRYLASLTHTTSHSIVLLLIRWVAGLGMFLHGLPKASNPTGWAGEALPELVQLLVVAAELGVPLLWVAGFLTPLAALSMGGVMVGAIFWHINKGDGFTTRPGYELAVMYLLLCLVLLIIGPGKFSLDYLWAKKSRP
jgi:putative oxidoreductase